MDHLPKPQNSIAPVLEVPFVANKRWDFIEPFDAFPSRHGFTQDNDDYTVNFSNHSLDDIAALIQSWLYFGFL